jgi:prepilin-type N-terminal cleavage/methylation domain-containing protein
MLAGKMKNAAVPAGRKECRMRIVDLTHEAQSSTQHSVFSIQYSKSGFTLVELLIVIALFIVVIGASLPLTSHLRVSAQLNDAADGLVHTIRTAQERAKSRFRGQAHGVYIDIQAATDDSIVLYMGSSYATRQSSFDRNIVLDSGLTLSTTLSGQDLNFSAGSADTNQFGITTTTITHSVDGHRHIVVNSLGVVEVE